MNYKNVYQLFMGENGKRETNLTQLYSQLCFVNLLFIGGEMKRRFVTHLF